MSRIYNFFRENQVLVMIETASSNGFCGLNLSNCEISRLPEQLLSCRHLTKLYLHNNILEALPEEIGNLENLTLLTLDYNQLRSIPFNISSLKNLLSLNLSHNKLGRILPEIEALKKLEVLWVNHNYLECIPPEIGNCTELDTLGLRGNFIKELPTEIGKLQNLRWLTLEGNLLTSLPEEINELKELVHLNLSNNRFEKFPKLDKLQELRFVFLAHNYIKELDASYMEGLTFIRKIDLRDNLVSDIEPFKHLKNLQFDDNFTPLSSNEEQDSSDSSEDWEESAHSSELNAGDNSDYEIPIEALANTLPKVAKFTATEKQSPVSKVTKSWSGESIALMKQSFRSLSS